ncbi:MAG: hypothetical protein IAE79_26520 [Anaerolinea sp.]|nr:hypothetical protein [Anaerolinea sp.]
MVRSIGGGWMFPARRSKIRFIGSWSGQRSIARVTAGKAKGQCAAHSAQ